VRQLAGSGNQSAVSEALGSVLPPVSIAEADDVVEMGVETSAIMQSSRASIWCMVPGRMSHESPGERIRSPSESSVSPMRRRIRMRRRKSGSDATEESC